MDDLYTPGEFAQQVHDNPDYYDQARPVYTVMTDGGRFRLTVQSVNYVNEGNIEVHGAPGGEHQPYLSLSGPDSLAPVSRMHDWTARLIIGDDQYKVESVVYADG